MPLLARNHRARPRSPFSLSGQPRRVGRSLYEDGKGQGGLVKAQGVLHGWGAHIFASCANAGIPLCTLHFPPLELVSAARVRDLVGRQAIDGHVLRGVHAGVRRRNRSVGNHGRVAPSQCRTLLKGHLSKGGTRRQGLAWSEGRGHTCTPFRLPACARTF